jgi:hypothetical protein
MDNTNVTQESTTIDDPFMAERPEYQAPSVFATDEEVELPVPDENGLVETDSYYFAPESMDGASGVEDSIYGYDGQGNPIFESEYLANPDAYTFAEGAPVMAGGFIRKNVADSASGTSNFIRHSQTFSSHQNQVNNFVRKIAPGTKTILRAVA